MAVRRLQEKTKELSERVIKEASGQMKSLTSETPLRDSIPTLTSSYMPFKFRCLSAFPPGLRHDDGS